MRIRIVTDTAADYSQEELTKLKIDLIELPVTLDGEEVSFADTDTFWQKLIAGKFANTSQPSREVFRSIFTEAQNNNEAVVCILISSHMSGTYESALAVKEEIGYENVFVIDSLNATVAEKLLVDEACKLRDSGMTATVIAQKVNELKHRVKIFACLDTLKYLARGGRISKSSAAIGTLINLKPLITFEDGNVVTCGKAFGTTQAMHKIIDKMREIAADDSYGYVPIYAYDSKNCVDFVNRAKEKGFEIDSKMTPIGATIGTHIGPDAFGIVYIKK